MSAAEPRLFHGPVISGVGCDYLGMPLSVFLPEPVFLRDVYRALPDLFTEYKEKNSFDQLDMWVMREDQQRHQF